MSPSWRVNKVIVNKITVTPGPLSRVERMMERRDEPADGTEASLPAATASRPDASVKGDPWGREG